MLFLVACDFSAATEVTDRYGTADTAGGDTAGGDTAGTDSAGAGQDSDAVVDTSPEDSGQVDADGDGWPAKLDCDDTNPTAHPEAVDDCDGVDSDCDGVVDEDTTDAFEPNDTRAYPLGSLEDDPSRSLTATLSSVADVDRYSFVIVDDTIDFFEVVATLSNVPADGLWLFELNRLSSDGDEELGTVASDSGGDGLSLTFSDRTGVEDGGEYELVVSALSGVDCARSYLLGVAQ